ncbi:MAG TPA: hypothetical protein VNK46_05340 [Nitrospiraceae bacterium]|jgi:RNase P/RNase MRP subunit p29|nr:hypothetical protein [Nitrospiraceae bacterium]
MKLKLTVTGFAAVKFLGTTVLSLAFAGCGLDGVRGTVVSVEENRYVIRDGRGREWHVHADERSHRDHVQAGEEVRVYVTKEGYAAFIQRLQ